MNDTDKKEIVNNIVKWVNEWNECGLRKRLSAVIISKLLLKNLNVYEKDGGIIIYLKTIKPIKYKIINIIVNPKKTGIGIGDILMSKLIKRAKTEGIKEIYINVAKEDSGLIPYLEKWGFMHFKDFYDNKGQIKRGFLLTI